MKNTVKLKSALRELKNRGETGELATALASLLATNDPKVAKKQDSKTLARRFLAQAAALLKRSPLPTSALAGEAHDFIGAAIELNRSNRPATISSKVLKKLTTAEAPAASFLPEPAQDLCDSCPFEDAEELQITAFANVLYNGGYIEEARRYLCAYNVLGSNENEEGDEEDMKTAKQALIAQRANLRKKGDFARAKVLNEIIADMEDIQEPPTEEAPQAAESRADVAMKSCDNIGDDQIKEEAMKAAYMMKAAEQMSQDPKADQSKAAGMLKAAEESMKACLSAWEAAKAASAPPAGDEGGKQTLEVEPASQEEEMAKQEASAAFQKGNIKKAKAKLAVASILEKKRLVAALLKKGDIELAMEGLKALAEEEKEAVPTEVEENNNAGYPGDEEEVLDDEAPPVDEETVDDDAQQSLDSETPVDDEDKEAPPPDEEEVEETDEKEEAQALYHETVRAVQQNKPKTAQRAVEKLEKLEAACRKGLRIAIKRKKRSLIAEGKAVVAAVHKAAVLAQAAASGLEESELTRKMYIAAKAAMRRGDNRTARGLVREISIIANAVKKASITASAAGDKKIAVEGNALFQKLRSTVIAGKRLVTAEDGDEGEIASEGSDEELDEENPVLEEEAGADADEEALDDSLDQAPTDASEEESEQAAEGDDEELPEEELPPTEDNAMHYEALSSVEQLQKMKVSRDALAFTFWDSNGAENPYWVVQASGKPVGEVHLGDQDSPEDIRAFFCDQVKWPNTIAQSVEKVGLYDMLKGVKARFYANAVDKSALASRMKQEAVANIGNIRTEKLATLKADFLDATVIAADSLNKGLIAGKPNALKKAFVERLMSLGISNPSLLVEDAFAEAFAPFMKQVMADAGDYLQMPKEAFEHTKKIIASATNVAHNQATVFAHESLSERLARTSMPLQNVPSAQEAPVTAAYHEASLRERQTDLKDRLKLSYR